MYVQRTGTIVQSCWSLNNRRGTATKCVGEGLLQGPLRLHTPCVVPNLEMLCELIHRDAVAALAHIQATATVCREVSQQSQVRRNGSLMIVCRERFRRKWRQLEGCHAHLQLLHVHSSTELCEVDESLYTWS